MGWATSYIGQLQAGNEVKFRPRGHSMTGKINSGQLVTISPNIDHLDLGDIVLCKVRGNQYVHLIKAIDGQRYLIGNNRGGTNGWITISNIFGKVISVEK